VGTAEERIVAEAARLLDDEEEYARMTRVHNPYGDGRACERIAGILAGGRIPAEMPAWQAESPLTALSSPRPSIP
jgi:UDP-N-acetylglucosamine 2-epimerase (non-hydrolysing)